MTHYVYTAWGADKRPLYVGCTNNLRRRMKEHAATGLLDGAIWIAVVPFEDRYEAEMAEAGRIAKLMPRANIHGNPGRRRPHLLMAQEMAPMEPRELEKVMWAARRFNEDPLDSCYTVGERRTVLLFMEMFPDWRSRRRGPAVSLGGAA